MISTVDLPSDSAAPTDSSELGVTAMQPDSSTEELPLEPSTPTPATLQPDVEEIRQTLIQLVEVVQPAAMVATPKTVLEATQRLVDVITELRSPHSGWAVDLPQTPETLLPYVTEEASDLLDALQQQATQPLPTPATPSPAIAHFLQQDYCSVADLTSWLLWAIARSGYAVMQLMEGMEVQIAHPDQEWQSGVLRLAIALKFDSPDQGWTLDLVTHQVCQPQLPLTTQIQSTALSPDSTLVANEFMQQIIQQIQQATPALCPFVKGFQTSLLMPQQEWRSGKLNLHFGLEFVATVSPQDIYPNSSPTKTDVLEVELFASTPQANPLKSLIQFTDANWSNHYSAIVNQQHLGAILTHLQTSGVCDNISLSSTTSIIDIVAAGLIITDQLQQPSTLASRNITHQVWDLNQFNLRLLWYVSRGAYEMMQLMAGIAAQVLQPGQQWKPGTLRLAVNLKLQTPELDWRLDLITGQPSSENTRFLVNDAVVRSPQDSLKGSQQNRWCQYPTLVKQLTHQVMHSIQHATPEIQLLLAGTDINLQHGDEPWQPGTLQLITGFEFVPDPTAM